MNVLVLVIAALVLGGLTGLFLWYPVRYGARGGLGLARTESLLAAYDARTLELADDAERGQLSATEYQEVQAELDRQLLADTERDQSRRARGGKPKWLWSLALSLGIVGGAMALYPFVGAFQDVRTYEALQATTDPAAAAVVWQEYLENEAEPAPQALYELASAQRAAGNLEMAAATLERVAARLDALENTDPEDLSAVMSEAAELSYRLNGEQLTHAIEQQFREALRYDPLNSQALATLGVAYFSAGELASAIELWERFLDVAPAGDARESVARILARARQQQAGTATGTQPAAAAGIQVLLSGLPETVDPRAQVYVVASTEDGAQPLAIRRQAAGDLPPALVLTDADPSSNMPALSSVARVSVVAFVVPPESRSLAEATWRSEPVSVSMSEAQPVVSLRLRPVEDF